MLKLFSIISVLYLINSTFAVQKEWDQCGGDNYSGSRICSSGLSCCRKDQWYSQCLSSCPSGWTATSVGDKVESEDEKILPIYAQCGGTDYSGSTDCAAGLQCFVQDEHYSQCLVTCPGGWQCSGATTIETPISTTQGATLPPATGDKFPKCRFRFGGSYFPDPNYDYSAFDYVTIWAGSPSSTHGTNFNPYWHGEMLKAAVKNKITPVYYAYIIAFMARDMWGLQDCDVGSPSLCQRGSEFIRKNRAEIVAKYKHYAEESAKIIGKNSEILWLIEPDFWQYYGDAHQENGPLSGTFMRQLFDDFALAIKSALPNARLSWDISAWIGESGMATWWSFFSNSPHIDYLHTSGGQSKANSDSIKPNELRWAFLSTLTGKRIIADTGYGVAGGSTGHNNDWDNLTNLRARITQGVIAVSQANPRLDWKTVLDQLRKDLAPLC